MSEFLCIILFAVIIYLLYYPNDPLGAVKKFRSITLYPLYSSCYHIQDDVEESRSAKVFTAKEKNADRSRKSEKVKSVKKPKSSDSNESLANREIGLTPGPGVIVNDVPSKFEESEFFKQSMRKKENRGKY
uniref:Uncharacterized protein n=1 Tax=Strongyloides stercoralis TaxID=6248 RepID=A0A0K0E363_STRER